MTLETPISNPDTYLDDMKHSVVDKLFFAAIVQPDIIVDYGCADGAVLRSYRRMFPDTDLIGYDISKDMIRRARNTPKDAGTRDIIFTDDWSNVQNSIKIGNYKSPAILLSSVFHEARTYLTDKQFNDFWKLRTFNHGIFRYVIIRDMMVSRDTHKQSDPLTVARIRSTYSKDLILDWEDVWGSINDHHSLIHFLLTYRYKENWYRELNEDYLPVDCENFMAMLPDSYRMVYFDHYVLPFLRERVREDFEIDLTDRTHIKIILERR